MNSRHPRSARGLDGCVRVLLLCTLATFGRSEIASDEPTTTSPLVSTTESDVLRSAEGVRLLRELKPRVGGDLGATLARVGDLDDDGADDFVVTAGGFRQRELEFWAVSSRTGLRLWSFTEEHFGDRMNHGSEPRAIASVGDADGDGVADLVVDVWRDGGLARVRVRSGRDGHSIALVDETTLRPLPVSGPLDAARAEFRCAPAIVDECGLVIVGVDDLDADGERDFVVGAAEGCQPSDGWIVSSRSLSAIGTTHGFPVASVPDVDLDGTPDLLVIDDPWSDSHAELRSSRSARVLARTRTLDELWTSMGDVDGDGFVDVGRASVVDVPPPPPQPSFATTFAPRRPPVPSPDRPVLLRAWSPRIGELVLDREIARVPARMRTVVFPCGDLDGDGRADFALSTHGLLDSAIISFFASQPSFVLRSFEVVEIARIRVRDAYLLGDVANLGDLDGDGTRECAVTLGGRGGDRIWILSFQPRGPGE